MMDWHQSQTRSVSAEAGLCLQSVSRTLEDIQDKFVQSI